jgi:hypothetical protein
MKKIHQINSQIQINSPKTTQKTRFHQSCQQPMKMKMLLKI